MLRTSCHLQKQDNNISYFFNNLLAMSDIETMRTPPHSKNDFIYCPFFYYLTYNLNTLFFFLYLDLFRY